MRSAVDAASDSVASLVDEFHVTDRALLRARDRIRKSTDSAALIEFHRQARRYFETLEREAAARGVELAGAELVGLMPAGAAIAAAGALLRIHGFDASHILELRLLE